jgi:hypothetical protein
VGSQFQVDTYTTSFQSSPSVAAEADGDFVVVWVSGSDASDYSNQGQRYGVPPLLPSLSAAGLAAGAVLMLLTVAAALRRRA